MRKELILLLAVATPVQSVFAAGFAVREQSAQAMGSAYAGAAATADDASFLAYNPAAAGIASGGDLSISAVSILPDSSANYTTALTSVGTPTGGSATPKDFIRNAIIPNLAFRQRLTDSWSLGVSVSVPWGLSTAYGSTHAGRYHAVGTKLVTLNITPVLAYDIAPNFTIAAGPQIQFASGSLTSAVDIGTIGAANAIPGSVPGAMDGAAAVKADDWAYGFVIGARAVLDGGWTLGASYRSSINHTLSGPLTFTLDNFGLGAGIRAATGLLTDTTSTTKLKTPDVIHLGLRKQFDDRWTLLAEVDRTGWSVFKELRIVAGNPVQPNDVTDAQWEDSWMGALGIEYAYDDSLTFRAGTAIDASPIPDSTLAPRIPDADRYWISGGLTYRMSPEMSLSATLSHLFNDTRTIAQNPAQPGNALRGTLAGTTSSSVNVIGLQFGYRWP